MKFLITSIIDVNKSAPNRLHHFIKFLSKRHHIKIVCINDWWKGGQVNTSKFYRDFKETLDRVDIRYITEKKMSPIAQEFLYPLLMKSLGDDFDAIFNYNTLISGWYTAKKVGSPVIYDLADDLPEMIASSPQIPRALRSLGKEAGRLALRKNIEVSRKVTGISQVLQRSYLISKEKFKLVPNGVDTSIFRNVKTDLKQELGLEGSFILGYVGVLREWIDLRPAFKALKNLDSVKMLIIGEEGEIALNKKAARDYKVEDKVIFTGTVPYLDVPKYISIMDACLIPFKQNPITHNAVPLKLFEYMACEKPVISTKLRGVYEAVGDRVIYADTAEEIALLVKNLLHCGPSKHDAKMGREFIVDRYDWENIGKEMERILMDCCS